MCGLVGRSAQNLATAFARRAAGLVAVALLVPLRVGAVGLPVNLGAAGPGNWAVLETGHNNSAPSVSISSFSSSGQIVGNVGMTRAGTIADVGTPIHGSVDLATGATLVRSTGTSVSGAVLQDAATQVSLTQVATLVANASAAASALRGTSLNTISTGGTMSAPGAYVVNSITLNSATLTLHGSASDYYVFNVLNSMSLNHASILLTGGLTSDHVLFNITHTGGVGFSMTGGAPSQSTLYGIVMANNSQVQVDAGLIYGEIISGDAINLSSGTQVRTGTSSGSTTNSVKAVPDNASTLLLSLLAMAGVFGFSIGNPKLTWNQAR